MTLAQQFRQEGRQEGQIEALQHTVIQALEIRFQRVPEGLGEEIGRIADPQRLQTLMRGALQSSTLEEFARLL